MSDTEILDINDPVLARQAADELDAQEAADLAELEKDPLRDRRAPDPIPAGVKGRRSREEEALYIFRSQIKFDDPELSVREVNRLAKQRLDKFLKKEPKLIKQFEKLAPTCLAPNRDDNFQMVEIAAMRRTPEIQKLEKSLRDVNDLDAIKNAFTMAVFEHAIFKKSVPELQTAFNEINGGGEMVKWAFGDPCGGRHPSRPNAVGKTLHPMLARNNPEMLIELNLDAIQRLARMNPDGRIGRYAVLDGTAIEANVLQKQSYSEAQARKLNKKTSAKFTMHDKGKKWRGYTLLTLTCMKSNLPLVWALVSSRPNAEDLQAMLDKLFECWEDCPLKYVVGDSEFDFSEYYEMLYCHYGIHGAFVTRAGSSKQDEKYFVRGVPRHCEHKEGENHDGLMTLRKKGGRDGWQTPESRAALGVARGEYLPYMNERIRWECTCCGDPEAVMTTRPHNPGANRTIPMPAALGEDNPRRFTYLPHAGNSTAAALRRALLLRRNSAEGMFSVLKRKQSGLGGCSKSRWISTDREMEWVLGGTLLGVTLSRMIHVDGSYHDALSEAAQLELYSVIDRRAFERHDLMTVIAA